MPCHQDHSRMFHDGQEKTCAEWVCVRCWVTTPPPAGPCAPPRGAGSPRGWLSNRLQKMFTWGKWIGPISFLFSNNINMKALSARCHPVSSRADVPEKPDHAGVVEKLQHTNWCLRSLVKSGFSPPDPLRGPLPFQYRDSPVHGAGMMPLSPPLASRSP